jgi:predicted metal-binding membrane protein
VLAALTALTALAWVYLVWLAAAPERMPMPSGSAGTVGMNMDMSAMAPAEHGLAWSGASLLLLFVMWAVMMVGMMTPSAAPMVLLYARVGRMAARQGRPFASSGWFLTGYLLAWTLFSVAATAAHAGLATARLLTPEMAAASPLLGAGLLIVAGLYQWTPLKDACLVQCRAPLEFIQSHGGFRSDAGGAVRLGLRHGLYCIGCCWPLMLLLFLGGVMSLLWIAALAALVLAEKVIAGGHLLNRGVGAALIAAGIALAVPAL